jgi:hypothetical protein
MKVRSTPISIGSAEYALKIMERSQSFNPEVKEWAGQAWKTFNYTTLDMPKFRSLMRKWWRENESHFAARNYKAVKPGGSWAEVLKSVTYYEGETVIQLPSESPTPSS